MITQSAELTKSEYTSKIQECKARLSDLTSVKQEEDKAIQRPYKWQGSYPNTLLGILDDITSKKAKIRGSLQLFTGKDVRKFMADFQIRVIPGSETKVDIEGPVPVGSIQVVSSGRQN